jgi:hypothetical protein
MYGCLVEVVEITEIEKDHKGNICTSGTDVSKKPDGYLVKMGG